MTSSHLTYQFRIPSLPYAIRWHPQLDRTDQLGKHSVGTGEIEKDLINDSVVGDVTHVGSIFPFFFSIFIIISSNPAHNKVYFLLKAKSTRRVNDSKIIFTLNIDLLIKPVYVFVYRSLAHRR